MQPRKPRTPEQIQQDTADCRAEAKRKTGYDPAQATKQASQPANAPASQADAAYQEAYKSCLTDRGYPLE